MTRPDAAGGLRARRNVGAGRYNDRAGVCACERGGPRWGGGMGTATSSTISVGTLVLDIYDPSSKKLVWTGRVTKTLDPGNNQEKKQKNLDKAMQKLLKNFPPKQ